MFAILYFISAFGLAPSKDGEKSYEKLSKHVFDSFSYILKKLFLHKKLSNPS
jgi:hypothetical protein